LFDANPETRIQVEQAENEMDLESCKKKLRTENLRIR